LDELDIRQPKEKPDENGRFTITLPKSGSVAKIRPLTFGEMLELDKREESYPTGMIAPKQTWKLSLMIDELDGNTDKGFIESKINTMPIMDSKYIRNFMNENEPFLDLRKKVIAPSGEEVYVNINFGVEFFRPFF
jgi:hypothetical protein